MYSLISFKTLNKFILKNFTLLFVKKKEICKLWTLLQQIFLGRQNKFHCKGSKLHKQYS